MADVIQLLNYRGKMHRVITASELFKAVGVPPRRELSPKQELFPMKGTKPHRHHQEPQASSENPPSVPAQPKETERPNVVTETHTPPTNPPGHPVDK